MYDNEKENRIKEAEMRAAELEMEVNKSSNNASLDSAREAMEDDRFIPLDKNENRER